MAVIKGNTTGSIFSTAYNLPAMIKSYSLTNRTGGNITASLAIIEPLVSSTYWRSETISANSSVSYDIPIILKKGFVINLIVSGSCDYYFNIDAID